MKFDFSGKNVLITGASRGIGRECTLQFAEAGAKVMVHYHSNRQAAEATLAQLTGAGHGLVQGDMGDVEDVMRISAETLTHFNHIDILINNAAIYEDHPIATATFEQWQNAWSRIIHTNLIGIAHLTYLVANQMIERGNEGRIVNVSSRGAFRGEPTAPAYGASKAGLNAMGQSLAKALAPHNIFVHTVAPGFVETDMAAKNLSGESGRAIRAQSPLNRVAMPDEVARTVLFCAAAGTEFLTGGIIDINGASYLRS